MNIDEENRMLQVENRALKHLLGLVDPCIHQQMAESFQGDAGDPKMTVMEYLQSRGIVTLPEGTPRPTGDCLCVHAIEQVAGRPTRHDPRCPLACDHRGTVYHPRNPDGPPYCTNCHQSGTDSIWAEVLRAKRVG